MHKSTAGASVTRLAKVNYGGWLFLVLVAFSGCSTSNQGRITAVPAESSAKSPHPLLDEVVELGTFEELSIRELFEHIAVIFFDGRIKVEGLGNSQFLDHISARPLREVLDRLCENECVWDVEGTPPTLTLCVKGLEQ